jgi:hypothetical protein
MGSDASDPQQPIGAPDLPAIEVEHRVRGTGNFDVAVLITGFAEDDDTVELVSLSERSRWLGMRHEVRFVVRGSAWDVARFWDDVRHGLPKNGGGFNPFDLLDWW